jgi:putative oxidoreductase
MNWNKATQITFFLFRVIVGFLFFQAGATKFVGWFGGLPGGMAQPPHFSQIGIGAMLEFFGGLLIVLGLGTRAVAFLLSGEMAVAYWQFHAKGGTWPHQNQGTAAVLFCFIYLFMAAHGGGDYSIDALIHGRRASKS